MSAQHEQSHENDKPSRLLKALELILADPAEIKKEAIALKEKYRKQHSGSSEDKINDLTAKKLISIYSYYAAFVGGATALPGVVPGLGTVIAAFGGTTADIALTMKYQVDMTMAIAVVYDHNIESEEGKRICLIIAGLGAANKAAKKGSEKLGTKAFARMLREKLKGATLVTVKAAFGKVGITFTRKTVEKAIPFGVGAFVGFVFNKALTKYVGKKAKDFFSAN